MNTDPISDFLTRIRNASRAALAQCAAPHSNQKLDIARILKEDGYISDYSESTDNHGHKTIIVHLKYVDRQPAINGLNRTSKPGRRIYTAAADIPKVLNGLGGNILSTSHGLMSGAMARRKNVGGEIICNVW
jgi:small subunit ribosomal protein S8